MFMILYVFLIANQIQSFFEKQVNNQILFLKVLVTNGGDQFCTLVLSKRNCD